MRKVIFGGANSLDNYFARKDHSVDWIMRSPEALEIMKEMWPLFDVMLMGRKTWEASIANFSEAELENARKMYAGMKTYIFSRTAPAGRVFDDIEIINTDVAEFVREQKQQEGKDIMLMGGGELAKPLFEAGLIDEIGFNIHPVLLGSGIPVFHEMSRQIDLELIEARPFKNGCVSVRYRVKN
jgi:dihydrofolate reductase